MFAYLRSHGKRTASNPTSPDGPTQLSDPPNTAPIIRRHFSNRTLNPAKSDVQLYQSEERAGNHDRDVEDEELNTPTISSLPPTLPPIPRVASVYEKIDGVQYTPSLLTPKSADQIRKPSRLQAREDVGSIAEEPVAVERVSTRTSTSAVTSPIDPPRQGSDQSDHSSSRPVLSRDPSSGSVSTTGLRSKGQSVTSPYRPRTSAGSASDFAMPLFPFVARNQPPPTISGPRPLTHTGGMSPSLFPTDCHRTPPMPAALPPPPPPPAAKPHSLSVQPLSVSTVSLVRSPEPPKTPKKSKLKNPMSRLLRRRAAPELEQLSDESLVSHRTVPTLPDNFDPSIRGNVVHDFSAPRPKRNYSAGTISTLPSSVSRETTREERRQGSHDSIKPEMAHTPVFKENFDDVESQETSNANLRAEQLANQDFIKRHSQTLDKALPLPPFARTPPSPDSPPAEPQTPISARPTRDDVSKADLELFPDFEASCPPRSEVLNPTPLTTVVEDVDSGTATPSKASKRRSPPSAARSRAASNLSVGDFQSAGLPQRLQSKSSRFSFQMVSGDSQAQERLLEERHIKKQAEKSNQPTRDSTMTEATGYDEEEGDTYDYDDMDLEGMEDDVPTVGDDWDYSGVGAGVRNLTLSTMGMSLSNDASTALARQSAIEQQASEPSEPPPQGLGIFSPVSSMSLDSLSGPMDADVISSDPPVASNNDDFYFDDGEFGDGDHDVLPDQQTFDESVFDDPSHHLYERRQLSAKLPLYDSTRTSQEIEEETAVQTRNVAPQNSRRNKRSCLPGDFQAPVLEPSETPEIMNDMATYHQALAQAALQAAEDGRFARKASIDTLANIENDLDNVRTGIDPGTESENDELESEDVLSSRPSLIPDDSRTSKATTSFSPSQLPSELLDNDTLDSDDLTHGALPVKNVLFSLPTVADGGFMSPALHMDMDDYDNCYEDDPMIAAANAEALAYDEEGDYGQEFGFYARPNPTVIQSSSSSQKMAHQQQIDPNDPNDPNAILTNGGYFGPKDWSEVKRQRSTREPNLTPITERSEFSTRNSFIGLENMGLPQGFPPQQFRTERQRSFGLPGGLPSPGLAQLARMSSPTWDSEMNIGALLRMRNRAFGGSQSSLQSGGGGGGSSPITSSPAQFLSSSMRDSVGSASGGGLLQPGRDPRALWSSPVTREVEFAPPRDDFDAYDDDDGLLDEVNRLSDGDEDEEDDVEGLADFRSPTSQYSMHAGVHEVPNDSIAPEDMEEEDEVQQLEDDDDDDEHTARLMVSDWSSSPPVMPASMSEDDSSNLVTPRKSRPKTLQLDLTPRASDQTKHLRPQSLPSPSQSPSAHGPLTSPMLSIEKQMAFFPVVPSFSPPKVAQSSSDHMVEHRQPAPVSPELSAKKAHLSLDSANIMAPAVKGHRRKGSDSVAYVQERDEVSGEMNWVLERRRTADDGAIEVLRREIVEGGRI